MKLKTIALVVTLVLFCGNASAQIVLGSQIDYAFIDSFKYEVRLVVYSDCRDSSFQLDTNSTFNISTYFSTPSSLSPTLVQVRNISNYHDSVSSCMASDTIFGVEEYTYLDTVNFNTTYSSLKDSSDILFLFSTNKRIIGDAISVSGTTRNSLNYAHLKLQLNARTRKFTSSPLFIQNQNQPFYTNHLVSINNGRDSVSFSYGSLHSNLAQTITINPGNPGYPPIPVYYPGSLNPPYTNPTASPPIGLLLDPETSDFIGTPTSNGLYDYVIAAKIWGLDSNGNRILAGKMRRDLMMKIKPGIGNNSPIIDGPFYYSVCEGTEICFHITTNDAVFVPPPPATAPAPDSVQVKWDKALEHLGAEFSIFDTTVRVETGLICWQTSDSSSSRVPYMFTVIAQDNSRTNAVSKRTFRIRVKQKARTLSRKFDAISCGSFRGIKTKIEVDTSFKGTPSYRLELLDMNLSILSPTAGLHFNSSQSVLSLEPEDMIVGDTTGTYIIQTTINNPPYNCATRYYDTVSIIARPTADGFWPTETLFCDVDQDTLKLNGTWSSFIWSTGDTTSFIEVSTNGFYSVIAEDSCGNLHRFSTLVLFETSPSNSIQDTFMCLGDSVTIAYSDSNSFEILWNDGSSEATFLAKDTGKYSYEVTKSCGITKGSFLVYDNTPKSLLLVDSSVCDKLTYSFVHLNPGENQSFWQNDSTKTDSSLVSYQKKQVFLQSYNECGSLALTLELEPITSPIISIADSQLLCAGTNIDIVAQGNYEDNWVWNTGATDSSITVSSPGTYSIKNSIYCGSASDTIFVYQDSLPNALVLEDTLLCNGDSIILRSLRTRTNDKIQWNVSTSDSTITVSKPGIYRLILTNACGVSSDSVRIDTSSMPVAYFGKDSLVDSPFTAKLYAGSADEYLWSTNETTDSIIVSDTGCYWVMLINGCGFDIDTICFIDTSSAGIGLSFLEMGIEIYPNPATKSFVLHSENTLIDQVVVFNAYGQAVIKEKVKQQLMLIDVSELANGTYFVQVKMGEEYAMSKLIIKN